jgi:HAE1 family hydrophobic/amphiphilic exporter-1
VLESIFRHRDNKQMIESVIEGAKEVSGAISASTFTTISIFLPVIYLYGITGKLFRDQALTVSFSLVSSLIVAITLLPALSAFKTVFRTNFSESFPEPGKKRWFHFPLKGLNQILLFPLRIVGTIIYFIVAAIFLAFKYIFKGAAELFNFILKPTYKLFNRAYDRFDEKYHRLLEKVLDKKIYAAILSGLVLCLLALTYLALDKELLPTPDSAKFEIKAGTIPSYGFDDTNRIAAAIEKELQTIDGVEFVFTESGAVSQFTARSEDFSVNNIHFIVRCQNPEIRGRAMNTAREMLSKADLLNFSMFLEKNTLSQYLSMEGDNFQVKVFYEDLEAGKVAVNRVMEKIQGTEGLSDLKTSLSEGKPLMALEFKQELLDQLNIPKNTISEFIRQAVSGQSAGTLKKIQQSFDIFVRIPSDGVIDLKKMLALPISVNDNIYYLRDLVTVVERPSIKEIERESQERFFMISARAAANELEDIIMTVGEKLESVQMPANTRYSFSGEEEERKKAFDSLQEAIILAILLVYMIMAAKFENIIQPFIIMFTVPMGLIGAFLFLLISGNTLNIISGIGILVLIGIGVNDAIVKVEYSNQLRDEGKPVREAVLTASQVRLRPILMTTFTTIFGLVPMALLSATGSELQRPLALVIIGGLLFTTFLTLILIPVSYEFVESLRTKRKDRKKG